MKDLVTLTDIKSLEQRYPFSELEMEILVRCYENLVRDDVGVATPASTAGAAAGAADESPSFLMRMALASPYSHYFLPEDASGQSRLAFLENNVLPCAFSTGLRDAISAGDAFVGYANQNQDEGLERFLEGVADTGRRGSRQALAVLYQIAIGKESATAAFNVMDLCYRLALASEVLEAPSFDKDSCLVKVKQLGPVVQDVSELLERHCGQDFTQAAFVDWAETRFPMLSAPLSTFVHHLLFREHSYPEGRIPYQLPVMDSKSDVFTTESSTLLTTMCLLSAPCNNKWHRLYSYRQDGASFETLEYSLLGYTGPTLVVVKTRADGSVLGAMCHSTWKDRRHYFGTSESFLFQIAPEVHVHPATGAETNFMYLHRTPPVLDDLAPLESQPHGLGFGGCMQKPRLFIPESMTGCTADFVDRTYTSGSLLPNESLERFEIEELEVWGVGGSSLIDQGLAKREEFRELQHAAQVDAGAIHDKSIVLGDFASGLMDSKLFKHQQSARGRPEFQVDEQHGGYKLQC